MRKIDVEELKQTQLEILDVVAKFCEDNQINYWIDCGTLLGAIRHKGFIPWDDDIDVGMLRPDYDKFMKLFNEKNTRYKFHCIENDPKFFASHGQVWDTNTVFYQSGRKYIKIAINIDIFVYDNAPDDDNLLQDMFDKRDFYQKLRLMRIYHYPIFAPAEGSLLRRLCVYAFRMLLRISPRYYFVRKAIENSKRYISQNTARVGDFSVCCEMRMVCDKKVFNDFIDVEFEGRKYKAPVGYDEWLRVMYGDYMQLPPVEERVSHHTFIAYKE